MSAAISSRRESWGLTILFCTALLVHFCFATFHWTVGFMPHQEFRQTQTALVSYYIGEQNNFSLLYETPLVGKPWVSILLEVPIYEWSVVGLSRATGLSHLLAARTISLTCFYLALPALYLLLGRLALSRPRRLLVLALVLVCPSYIFYSRAFLMESMELLCCAWFLFGFVRTMDDRRWSWLILTIVAGTGASLIKSATYAVWLLPAAAYGAWLLWRDLHAGQGWRGPVRTLCWGLATVAVPLGALRWWINLTDPIKAAHASAYLFTSEALSQDNWGLFDFAAGFSPKVWSMLLKNWQEAIMAPWIIAVVLISGLVALKQVRARVLGLAAVFFFAQFMFPFAYAYQEYYYYACAVFVLGAIGLVLHGLLDSKLPRWCCWLVIALPFAAQLTAYRHGYFPDQNLKFDGGFNYTAVLRDFTPRKSIVVVAGNDWCAIIPYYSQRRALMIRNGLEHDAAYLHRAIEELAGEEVSAVVLVGPLRYNEALLKLFAGRFNLDRSSPTLSEDFTDVYVSRPYIEKVQAQVRSSHDYPKIKLGAKLAEEKPGAVAFALTPEQARGPFACVTPEPFKGRFAYGFSSMDVEGQLAVLVNPSSDLWLRPPVHATQIKWDFGIVPNAYLRAGDKTDGVEFIVAGEMPDGNRRQIFRRVLDPVNQPADRGHQHEIIPYQPLPGESLVFSNRPNLSESYDWAYWLRIDVK
jgi:Dolichyl-phosphate-mannose-protein mannosyltransferase